MGDAGEFKNRWRSVKSGIQALPGGSLGFYFSSFGGVIFDLSNGRCGARSFL